MSEFAEPGVRVTDLNPDSFRERLHRAKGHMTSQELADLSGIPKGTVAAYLAKPRSSSSGMPGIERLVALSDALGVSLDWLATGRGSMDESEIDDFVSAEARSNQSDGISIIFDQIWFQIHSMYTDTKVSIGPDLPGRILKAAMRIDSIHPDHQPHSISECIVEEIEILRKRASWSNELLQGPRKSE